MVEKHDLTEKITLKGIYNFGENDEVIVVGISKVEPLAKMQEIGCIGTGKFKPLQITSADAGIKKGRIVVFSRGNEMYHNRASAPQDLILYKSLIDVEGTKCLMIESFVKKAGIKEED